MGDSVDTLREQSKQRNEGIAFLLAISQKVASGGALTNLLPELLQLTLRYTQADGVRLVILEGDVYGDGAASPHMAAHDTLISNLVVERGVLHISDTTADTTPPMAQLRAAGRTVVALPLIAFKTQRGALWLCYNQLQQVSAEDIELLTLLSTQVAALVGSSQNLSLAQSERSQLAAILNSTLDPVLVIDKDERITLLNPAAEHTFGIRSADAIGRPLTKTLNAEALIELLRQEKEESGEWQDATGQTFASRVSNMDDRRGRRIGRVLILRDITRYRNLRDNQSEFVSTVSHDLRSPLTFMHGYATMLPMVGPLNEKQKGFVDKIILGIAQMTDLVDKILDASRLDPEGNYQLSREACDISKLVNDIATTHQPNAEKKKLALKVDIGSGLPILLLDQVMMQRAMNNLVDNAIKYTPEDGTVTIGAAVKENDLMLTVRDTGLGISEENQKHLFERFRRVRRREHQAVKGNGLGLFIVRSVAQRHGGDAWVESKEGEGSTFAIRIPIAGANLPGAKE